MADTAQRDARRRRSEGVKQIKKSPLKSVTLLYRGAVSQESVLLVELTLRRTTLEREPVPINAGNRLIEIEQKQKKRINYHGICSRQRGKRTGL